MSDAKPNGGKRTLVEEGTQLKGSLSSSCPIDVRGRVEGELTAPSLTVSATGAVHGKVKVADFVSEGEISGEVDADVVRLSGVVKDNTVLRAKSLEVKLASAKGKVQVTFGECVLEVGDAPTREVETGKRDEAPKAEAAPRSVPPPPQPTTPSAPPPPIS
jgi:cytoskeletal protein CcmA (bactofilin family)